MNVVFPLSFFAGGSAARTLPVTASRAISRNQREKWNVMEGIIQRGGSSHDECSILLEAVGRRKSGKGGRKADFASPIVNSRLHLCPGLTSTIRYVIPSDARVITKLRSSSGTFTGRQLTASAIFQRILASQLVNARPSGSNSLSRKISRIP